MLEGYALSLPPEAPRLGLSHERDKMNEDIRATIEGMEKQIAPLIECIAAIDKVRSEALGAVFSCPGLNASLTETRSRLTHCFRRHQDAAEKFKEDNPIKEDGPDAA